MANKLTTENIEAAVQHLENIQSGKTPILDGVDRTVEDAEIIEPLDLGNQVINKKEKRVFPLIPPSDPRLLMQIAPFMDDTLENFEFEDRKALCKVMYDNMVKYGGLGLSANQVGLPYRMFVMGGHPQVEDGKVRYVFNPLVNDVSEEAVMLKEGCLSFPFLFLGIKNGKDKQPSFNITDSWLISLIIGLKTLLTLPSSISGWPPITNIRYGSPT